MRIIITIIFLCFISAIDHPVSQDPGTHIFELTVSPPAKGSVVTITFQTN